ncbi:unnamed protein product, partial [Closterium sp. NIES-53]
QQAGQHAVGQQGQQGKQAGQAVLGLGSGSGSGRGRSDDSTSTAAGETIPGDGGWGGGSVDLDAATGCKAEGFDPEAYVDDWGETDAGTHTYLPPRACEVRQVAARFGVPPALVRDSSEDGDGDGDGDGSGLWRTGRTKGTTGTTG